MRALVQGCGCHDGYLFGVTMAGAVACWDLCNMRPGSFAAKPAPTPLAVWDAFTNLEQYALSQPHRYSVLQAAAGPMNPGGAKSNIMTAHIAAVVHSTSADACTLQLVYSNGWTAVHDVHTGIVKRAHQPSQRVMLPLGAPEDVPKTEQVFRGSNLSCTVCPHAAATCDVTGSVVIPQLRMCVEAVAPRHEEVARVAFRGSEGLSASSVEGINVLANLAVMDIVPARNASSTGSLSRGGSGSGSAATAAASSGSTVIETVGSVTAVAAVPQQHPLLIAGYADGSVGLLVNDMPAT